MFDMVYYAIKKLKHQCTNFLIPPRMYKDAVFECSVICLFVIIELLHGLILFTSKWHAGKSLDKNNTLNIDYCFLTTVYEMDIRTHSVGMSQRG